MAHSRSIFSLFRGEARLKGLASALRTRGPSRLLRCDSKRDVTDAVDSVAGYESAQEQLASQIKTHTADIVEIDRTAELFLLLWDHMFSWEKEGSTDGTATASPLESSTCRTVVLALGCFWCSEAYLSRVPGIVDVKPGYCMDQDDEGNSQEVEVVEVTYDSRAISYSTLLKQAVTLVRTTATIEGPSASKPQYKKVLYYLNEEEREEAKEVLAASPEALKISMCPLATFRPANAVDQQFYDLNPTHPYCINVIAPTLYQLKEYLH